jgi:CheY-like chemotaxis protein
VIPGRVLLIDDNDDQRSMLANALRARGWNVDVAASGKQGIERAQLARPDVVMTELLLPDVRAYHFARTLRSVIEHDMRVIALTRLPVSLHRRALAEGFDLVECKPIDPDRLHEKLTALVLARAS